MLIRSAGLFPWLRRRNEALPDHPSDIHACKLRRRKASDESVMDGYDMSLSHGHDWILDKDMTPGGLGGDAVVMVMHVSIDSGGGGWIPMEGCPLDIGWVYVWLVVIFWYPW